MARAESRHKRWSVLLVLHTKKAETSQILPLHRPLSAITCQNLYIALLASPTRGMESATLKLLLQFLP